MTIPADPVPSPAVEDLRRAVSTRVQQAMAELAAQHAGVGPETGDLFVVGRTLLAGGKRLRASFAGAGWLGFGGEETADAIVRAGAGLELFQMAALVHDDIIDSSLTRRGLPAAHRHLAALHGEGSMLSDPDHFGLSGAILLGDLLLVASTRELHAAFDGLDAAARARSRAIVEEMMAEVTIGQYLDIYAQAAPWADDPRTDLDRAHRVVRSKSARYSVEHPLTLGAAMAGADDAGLRVCAAIGLPIGEAFQLRDDVLGVFGEPAVTGKPAGDDLREGKRTVLVTSALTRATPEDAARLRAALGDPDLDGATVAAVREILTRSGALDEVERIIAERTRAGLDAIDAADLPPAAADRLRELADAAITRSA